MAAHNHKPEETPAQLCKACIKDIFEQIDKAPLRPSAPMVLSRKDAEDIAAWINEGELPLGPGVTCSYCGNDTGYGNEPDEIFCSWCNEKIVLLPPLVFPDVSNL